MSSKPGGTNHRIAFFLSLAVSGGIVVWLLTGLDWQEVGTHFRRVNPWYLPVLVAGIFPLLWLRALRWRLLLPDRDRLSVPRLIDGTIIGFFASYILPLRAGELVRPWIITRWQPVTFSAALASIVVERLADSICLLTLMLVCLTRVPDVPDVVLAGARVLLSLSVVLIGIIVISYALPGKVEAFFHRIVHLTAGRAAPALAAKINGMITEYFKGLRVISTPGQLFRVVALSFAMWLLVAFWYQLVLWSFGEFPSLWVGMMVNVMVALAVAAPSAPGFIGVFQVGCILALSTVYGYPKEFAVAYSVVGHMIQFGFNIAAGLIVLHRHGLHMNQLKPTQPPPT